MPIVNSNFAPTFSLKTSDAHLSGGAVAPEDARVVKTVNTLHLDRLFISSALVKELQQESEWVISARSQPLSFNDAGELLL